MALFAQIGNARPAYFRMDSETVFAFAAEKGTEVLLELLDMYRVAVTDIRPFVSHQANVNILRRIAEAQGIPTDRFFVTLDRYGNTASASVPIALDEAWVTVSLTLTLWSARCDPDCLRFWAEQGEAAFAPDNFFWANAAGGSDGVLRPAAEEPGPWMGGPPIPVISPVPVFTRKNR